MKRLFYAICILLIFTANLYSANITQKEVRGVRGPVHEYNYGIIFDYLNLLDPDGDGVLDTYGYSEVPISDMKDGSNAPAALDDASTRSPYAYRDFDDATDEDLNFVWIVPPDLTGTTVNYRVFYLTTNATFPVAGEGVAFSVTGVSLASGDMTNATKGAAALSYDTVLTDGSQYHFRMTDWSADLTITGLTAGESSEINLSRDVSDTIDDYGQDVGPYNMQFRYDRKITK